MPSNIACSRQVGLGAFFEPFPGFGFILRSSRVHAPPTCGYRLLAVSRVVRKKDRCLLFWGRLRHTHQRFCLLGFKKNSFYSTVPKCSNRVLPCAPRLLVWKRSVWELCRVQTVSYRFAHPGASKHIWQTACR